MSIEKVIVLEDDLIVRNNLEQCLRRRRYDVASATTLAAAQELLGKDNFDLIFLDMRLPDGDGTELLKAIQQRPQKPLVVVTTGFGSIESAVECMKNGAFDYMIKPFSNEQIEFTLRKAEEFTQLLRVNRFLSQEADEGASELLGHSPAMENVRQLIRKVARTHATVLIHGESGTGKELVARALYLESPRASAPFIRVNCAAVPENLIESEFFGHEKGSFTGALTKREGRFELAHGGTILLDEISEISPNVQAKLLRVLQERELERVGGNRTIKVDVRVIATTNRNLEVSVEKKEFRQDLYFRLNVVPIHVPPLRERLEDVPYLSDEFMKRFSRKHGVPIKGFSDEAMRMLKNHSWPGNVRELQNIIERAVILCGENGILEPEHLGLVLSQQAAPAASTGSATNAPSTDNGALPPLAEMEKRHILAALEQCKGNRTHAAKLLDVSIRTLRNKLHEYNGTSPKAEEEAAVEE
ncbi:MAG TPA: sigma-54 dependent transcriptional regulator [Verrucomicrobiae bacterium]|jgi:DNA-binding NtrC family response regulator|nr:sigma-54 dependent transcriptional regulator [Verrucomicrobiae bacterium]